METTYKLPYFSLKSEEGKDNDDPTIVKSFLESLDGFFDNFVGDPFNFAEWLNDKKIGELDSANFTTSWNEAKEYLKKALKRFDLYVEEGTLSTKLGSIGFTNASLKAKANILNSLSNRVGKYLKETLDTLGHEGNNIFSFLFQNDSNTRNNNRFSFLFAPFYNIFKDLLEYINSLLGSLSEIFPILGPVKEFKEQIEGIINLTNGIPRLGITWD